MEKLAGVMSGRPAASAVMAAVVGRTCADSGRTADRVDRHIIHPVGRDHHGAVRRPDDLVAGGLHQDGPVLRGRESDGGLGIGRAFRHHDHRRLQFMIEVEDGAFLVVSRVARQQNRTCHGGREGCGILRQYR